MRLKNNLIRHKLLVKNITRWERLFSRFGKVAGFRVRLHFSIAISAFWYRPAHPFSALCTPLPGLFTLFSYKINGRYARDDFFLARPDAEMHGLQNHAVLFLPLKRLRQNMLRQLFQTRAKQINQLKNKIMDYFFKLTEEEKKDIEQWQQQLSNVADPVAINILLVLLYKVNKMEKKLNIIQDLVTTHWAR